MKKQKKKMTEMDKQQIEVIGVDHGWSAMKTASGLFTSGVNVITTEPAFYENVVEYKDTYYKVGGKRLEVRDTKVEDDNYYIMTLASIANELDKRKLDTATILLAVGLPLTRFGAEKQGFINYLHRDKEVKYCFGKSSYHIKIARVSVFPQCYAAVANMIKEMPRNVVVVDIGSWTMDVMPIKDYMPDEPACVTIQNGIIKSMRSINEQCVRQIGNEVTEEDIISYIVNRQCGLPQKYVDVMENEVFKFVNMVYCTLKELGYNLETTPIVYVGGGASVMKSFQCMDGNFRYIEDIHANAKGFEYLGNMFLKSNPIKI